MLRFRLFDFLVRMCLLKAFWCVIFPVPVILKRFLALEFVLTFGIFFIYACYTLEAFFTGRNLGSLFRQWLLFEQEGAKIQAKPLSPTKNSRIISPGPEFEPSCPIRLFP